MFPSDDLDSQLRRRQILQQMSQTQSPTAAMLGGGANLGQFQDTGPSQDATYQPPSAASGLGILAKAIMPEAASRAIATPGARLSAGIGGLMSGKGLSGFKGPGAVDHTPTMDKVANPPTMVNRTPLNQPTLQPGQMLTIDPNGAVVAMPRPIDPNLR